MKNPLDWFKLNNKGSRRNRRLLSAEWNDINGNLFLYMKLWIQGVALYDNKRRWKILMLLQLRIDFESWKSVLEQLNIKILVSLSNIDPMNAAKTMAARRVDGLVIGGHLSNHPIFSVQTERFYDVALAWGPHFHSHLFSRYPSRAVISTGYYFDYKFKDYRHQSEKIRQKYPGKFIITFMDNVFSQDLIYSKENIKLAYELLFDIIDSYPDVLIFAKPKREDYFNRAKKVVPLLESYITEGKVIPFITDPLTGHIYKPALVALASDLVIGFGINSAEAEAQFAGAPSFHLDLPGTSSNQFAQKGLGTVIFHTYEDMKKAIIRQLNPDTSISYEKISEYYKDLDPYQDGLAYKRTGTFIYALQKGLEEGLSADSSIKKAAISLKKSNRSWFRVPSWCSIINAFNPEPRTLNGYKKDYKARPEFIQLNTN